MYRRVLLGVLILWPDVAHAQGGPRDVIDTITPSIVHVTRAAA